jgi:hypothetical protein
MSRLRGLVQLADIVTSFKVHCQDGAAGALGRSLLLCHCQWLLLQWDFAWLGCPFTGAFFGGMPETATAWAELERRAGARVAMGAECAGGEGNLGIVVRFWD